MQVRNTLPIDQGEDRLWIAGSVFKVIKKYDDGTLDLQDEKGKLLAAYANPYGNSVSVDNFEAV